MKAIHTLALIAAGAVSFSSTPLYTAEPGGSSEMSLHKSHPCQPHVGYDAIPVNEKPGAQVQEKERFQFQKEVGNRPAAQASPAAGTQPRSVYAPMDQLKAARPNNVVRSQKYSNVEYSGILVQSLRDNPVQMFNPLAPAEYGDGEANTVRSVITGRAVGLKLLAIHF